jgi:hypothetical protein
VSPGWEVTGGVRASASFQNSRSACKLIASRFLRIFLANPERSRSVPVLSAFETALSDGHTTLTACHGSMCEMKGLDGSNPSLSANQSPVSRYSRLEPAVASRCDRSDIPRPTTAFSLSLIPSSANKYGRASSGMNLDSFSW